MRSRLRTSTATATPTSRFGAGRRYMVQLGKGDGSFYPVVNYATPAGRFEMGGHGDLNGDGAVDFLYPSSSGVTVVMNAADDRANVAGAVGFRGGDAGFDHGRSFAADDRHGGGRRWSILLPASGAPSTSPATTRPLPPAPRLHLHGGGRRRPLASPDSVRIGHPGHANRDRRGPVPGEYHAIGGRHRRCFAASRSANPTTLGRRGSPTAVTVTALDVLGNRGGRLHQHDPLHQLGRRRRACLLTTPSPPTTSGVHTFAVTLKTSGSRYVGVGRDSAARPPVDRTSM